MSNASRIPGDTPNQCPSCGHDLILECSAPFGDVPCPHCKKPLAFVVAESYQRVRVVRFGKAQLYDLDSPTLEKQLEGFRGVPRILLDFANVESISSTGLGRLITWQKTISKAGGKLRLCGLRPKIREVLNSSRLDRLFEVHPDEEAAMNSF